MTRLGKWADDPIFADILAQEGIALSDDPEDDPIEDELWFAYSDAWYAGVHDQVIADCRARLGLGG